MFQPLRVTDNRRFLVHQDGTPFFYLGDTAWELFHRLTLEEAEVYFRNRAAKGFTVVQAVALPEFEAWTLPNAYGEFCLQGQDPTKPNGRWFDHVVAMVDLAASLGLRTAVLPTWGDKWNQKWGEGPEIFTPDNAEAYGRYLGQRLKDRPVIWVLGGDRPVETPAHRAILDAMAAGLTAGDGGAHLKTYHPSGQSSSGQFVHDAAWLDFNLAQSGHGQDRPVGDLIAADYARQPIKPCFDGEPCYEDHPIDFDPDKGYLTDLDVRKACYRALFAGAHGHTYGCHPVWGFATEQRKVGKTVRHTWREALEFPGATHVGHARRLLLSRPYLTRVPDQGLLSGGAGSGASHRRACRDSDGSYAMLYLPAKGNVAVDTSRLRAKRLNVWWYSPRVATAAARGQVDGGGVVELEAPREGPDWVLVLDDAARDYPPPGTL